MKIKKIVFLIIFMLFLFPFTIQAEECKKTDIKIEKVELSEVSGNAEETSTASNDHNQIHLNTKMNVVGDSITYKAVIKNTSNSDYVFDKTQLTKDYINYDIRYEDDSNIIKAGEEKVIYLRLNYEIKPQVETLSNGVYTSNSQVSFHFVNESGTILNPETKNNVFIIFLIFAIIIGGLIIQRKNSKKVSIMIAILSLFILPKMVNAICTCTLDIHLNLKIDAKEATFLSGKEVNIKMKQLAGDDTSTVTNAYAFQDKLITSIQYSEVEPDTINKEEKNIVSTIDSSYPIYMWYDNGAIYWWSEDKTPALNEDASYMFSRFSFLKDIQGLSYFDTSSTTSLAYLFNWSGLLNINSLSYWNTTNVINLNGVFNNNMSLVDVSGLKNWDVSNVQLMSGLFSCCYELEEIDLRNWKTPSLVSMNYMFASLYYSLDYTLVSKLKRIYMSEDFDTSKVTNMHGLFYNDRFIEDYSFLKYFDTSSVTTMNCMFQDNLTFHNLDYIENWDVSKVTDFSLTFCACESLTDLNGLEKWNVSSSTKMYRMFYESNHLEDVSSINDWDISNVTDFRDMFWRVSMHPEFSKRVGTWSDGTFTPSS